jgi:hypothetical protein
MRILAIDPGSEYSAYVVYDSAAKMICASDLCSNTLIVQAIHRGALAENHLAIEMIASYGMPVGRTVFETCVWIGRFIEAWQRVSFTYVYRRDVKMHLCNSVRAKDSNVRQALIDLFPASGGGATPQIGTKKKPGPLYGFKKDLWAALGVAVTFAAQQAETEA